MKTFLEFAGELLEPQGNASDRYNKEVGRALQKWYLAGLKRGMDIEDLDALEASIALVEKTGVPL